jgi:hypothetical protein
MKDVCWTAFGKRLVFAWRSSAARDWRKSAVPSTVLAFDAWDRKMRRRFGLLRTIRWFGRTNQPGKRWMIASLHWPHRLCWSWCLDWAVVSRECAGFKMTYGYRQFALVLWRRQLSLHWQESDWMPALAYRGEAPEVIWKHDIERAMYLERALKRERENV